MFSFSRLLLFSSHVKPVNNNKPMWLKLFLKGRPLSAEEEAKSYGVNVLETRTVCAVASISEVSWECGCRGWHVLISALGCHRSFE